MKMDISVAEVMELINEIRQEPDNLFQMIRANVKESVGHYLTELLETELTGFLGRDRYERTKDESNHRNGSYGRKFAMKGIGQVDVKVPRDRKGGFTTQVLPRSKQYEDALREDLCAMFLSGVSTRTLALMSERLIGRRISPVEVSNASRELSHAVEAWREPSVVRVARAHSARKPATCSRESPSAWPHSPGLPPYSGSCRRYCDGRIRP